VENYTVCVLVPNEENAAAVQSLREQALKGSDAQYLSSHLFAISFAEECGGQSGFSDKERSERINDLLAAWKQVSQKIALYGIYYQNTALIGMCIAQATDDTEVVYWSSFYVDRSHRGKRLASKMWGFRKEDCERKSYKKAIIKVHPSNKGVLQFYEENGARKTGETHNITFADSSTGSLHTLELTAWGSQ